MYLVPIIALGERTSDSVNRIRPFLIKRVVQTVLTTPSSKVIARKPLLQDLPLHKHFIGNTSSLGLGVGPL